MKPIVAFVTEKWGSVQRSLRPAPYKTQTVEDQLPVLLDKRVLYIVEDDGIEEQAAMLCPCRCGAVLHLNLLTDDRPCWHVTRHDDGTASLRPSVWRQKGCRAHFWFRSGRVQWCRGGKRPWWKWWAK